MMTAMKHLAATLIVAFAPVTPQTLPPDRDAVVKAVRDLKNDDVTAMLNATREYGIKLPAANGKSATVGFCWGGGTSFRYASEQPELNAAAVYYGTSPDAAALEKIKAP